MSARQSLAGSAVPGRARDREGKEGVPVSVLALGLLLAVVRPAADARFQDVEDALLDRLRSGGSLALGDGYELRAERVDRHLLIGPIIFERVQAGAIAVAARGELIFNHPAATV